MAMIGFITLLMMIGMTLRNRVPVAQMIQKNQPEHTFRHTLGRKWSTLFIGYVIVFWAFWMINLMLFGAHTIISAAVTLLSPFIFLILDGKVRSNTRES
jgi:hypothetical protein